ncbi:MAG: heparinase II/III family protein [Planctomycetaceae bacterium]
MTPPRWWYLLRYHRPSQLVGRGVSMMRRRLFPLLTRAKFFDPDGALLVPRENAGFDAIVLRQLKLRAARPEDAARGMEISEGTFTFLNERRRLPLPIDWTLSSIAPVSPLWRFHLHYHEFLLDLLETSRAKSGSDPEAHLWSIVDDWITANPVGRPGALMDAWHPFCLSKRIAVWLMLWHAAEPPAELRNRFASSLEAQVRFLERHLEWDLRGNHLLENLRTLALSGAFFAGRAAERRLDRAVSLLHRQLAEQILPSGEHFERAPMYHAQMLSAVLDVRDAVQALRPEFAATCARTAGRMGEFLEATIPPDGGVPLLSDTALGETPDVGILLAEIGGELRRSSRSTGDPDVRIGGGYWTWRSAKDCLLFDAGPVGADELPAHAHCDLLTIEASFSGERVIVDSGVYDYADGEMRRYCRSTAAHNVLQIDGVEQCDMWSRFRMGYRGHPSSLEHGRDREFDWCRATHNAYRRIGVPRVGRWLACRANGPWFCVDWAQGAGRHELVDRLHLSPDVGVAAESSHAVRIDMGERSLVVRSLTDAEITIEQGWYCPEFGVRWEAPVLEIRTSAALPACLGWMVVEAGCRTRASLKATSAGRTQLTFGDNDSERILNPIGPLEVQTLMVNESAQMKA